MSTLKERFCSSAKELKRISSLAGASVLLALGVVLHNFTIVISEALQIGVSFLTLAVTGFMYGPVVGAVSGMAGDLIKYFVRPTGAYFPGFTLNALLSGLIYGLILYNKPITVRRVFAAKFCATVIINLILTPIWLNLMYGKAFWVYFSARIVKNLVLLPIETAMLYFMIKLMDQVKKRIGNR